MISLKKLKNLGNVEKENDYYHSDYSYLYVIKV